MQLAKDADCRKIPKKKKKRGGISWMLPAVQQHEEEEILGQGRETVVTGG